MVCHGTAVDPVLRFLLVAGDGRVTRAEALRHGVLDTQVRRAIRAGELVRRGRGGYATPVPFPTPEAAHASHARAAWDASRAEAISHYSALACHGLPTYGCDLDIVHLATPRRDGRWRRPGLVVHALPRGVVPVNGLVPIPYALVQTGLAAGPFAFVASADAAIHRDLTARSDIEAAVRGLTRAPGVAALRPATARIDGRSESVLERGAAGHRAVGMVGGGAVPRGGERPWVPRRPPPRRRMGARRVRRDGQVRRPRRPLTREASRG